MRQEHSHALYQGLVAGVIGYAVVALFLMVVNLVAGRPALFTADVPRPALFSGAAAGGADPPRDLVVVHSGSEPGGRSGDGGVLPRHPSAAARRAGPDRRLSRRLRRPATACDPGARAGARPATPPRPGLRG